MTTRVKKAVALGLIKFVKKVEVSANYWDPVAVSAVEFARQLSSKKLKKANPSFEFDMKFHESSDPARVKVEFTNGKMWESTTAEYKAHELRSELFFHARIAEDEFDISNEGAVVTDDLDSAGGSKGGGGGGGAKKSGGGGGGGGGGEKKGGKK